MGDKVNILPPPVPPSQQNGGEVSYCDAIRSALVYLLKTRPEFFVIGQGVWSPWYVGGSMTDLDKEFGRSRIIDTPVSEQATTGVAIGAALFGYRPLVVHPRMDFMVLALDQIVNQAAKWSHMFGGQAHPSVTIRGIISRGGEQGAQHSQALHAWLAHIPGLRVVMPASVRDARDLLIGSVLCNDPVLFIDDKWLFSQTVDALPEIVEVDLRTEGPMVVREGQDLTIVGMGYSTSQCLDVAQTLAEEGIHIEVVDIRVLNPFNPDVVIESVKKTGRLLVVDGGWKVCGFAGEVIASVAEGVPPTAMKVSPTRITLPAAPAPSSRRLEELYYPDLVTIAQAVRSVVREN